MNLHTREFPQFLEQPLYLIWKLSQYKKLIILQQPGFSQPFFSTTDFQFITLEIYPFTPAINSPTNSPTEVTNFPGS